jgi:CRISPR-associated endonuclease Cas1
MKERDTSITLSCHYCGELFSPWHHAKYNKGNVSQYCSAACRSRAVLQKVNGNSNGTIEPLPLRIAVAPTNDDIQTTSNADELGENWQNSGMHWDSVEQWYLDKSSAEAKRTAVKNSAYSTLASEGRTITLTGFNSRLSVKRGNLIVQSGHVYAAESPNVETLYSGIHGTSTIIWLTNGHSGSLSIDALKWCSMQNITIRILTNRGEHMATIHPSPDAIQALGYPKTENGRVDIALRRAQYNLQPSGKDIELARLIITRKLYAQRKCLDEHVELPDRDRGYTAIDTALNWLLQDKPKQGYTLDNIRLNEARAANAYFLSFRGLSLQLDEKALKNWPPHWRVFAERNSALTRFMSARLATCPINAMLNFVYAMLESQIRTSLNAIGADVACGILHGDKDNRDSLVFDCIEALRGEIDSLLLNFINTHVFSSGDFNVAQTGQVSIHPSLCRVLAEQVRITQRKADDEARWFRTELFKLMRV